MSKNLFIVGTIHIDPNGEERLIELYEKLTPKIVTLETSKDMMDIFEPEMHEQYLINSIQKLVEKLGLEFAPGQDEEFANKLKKMLLIHGYEYRAVKAYSNKNGGTNIEPIDIPRCNQENLLDLYVEFFFYQHSPSDAKSMFQTILDTDIKDIFTNYAAYSELSYIKYDLILSLYPLLKNSPNFFEDLRFGENPKPPAGLSEGCKALFQRIYSSEREDFLAANIRELYAALESGNMVAPVGCSHLFSLWARLDDLQPRVITLQDYDTILPFQLLATQTKP